jgi:pyrroline-5-carboxylate reductase
MLRSKNMRKVGIIGYGSIGKMIFAKLVGSKVVDESDIFISTEAYNELLSLKTAYPKLNICETNKDLAKNADIIFMCVRAMDIKIVLSEIIADAKQDCHLVSLNACVMFGQMEQIFSGRKISKIMPNINGEINQSITLAAHNDYVNDDDKSGLKTLLESFGTVIELSSETDIGIGMELTACMPGYIGAALKIIIDETEKHTSMKKTDMIRMLVGTVSATGKLLLEKEMSFDELVTRVATKGGITEEGTKIMGEKMPEMVSKIFEKTNEKRRITTENVQKGYDP